MKVEIGSATLYLGNCLDVLKTLPDNSIESFVTDPPYGLSFMGKKWDYDVPSEEIWAECLRVLKPGGHLLAFAGTRTQHRMAVRIEDAGFEIRDMIAWVYGSGFPKSHNLKDEWQGWGTALKPALEPITVARKPLVGTVAENVLTHGTGALNIDGCRVDASDGRPLIVGDYKPTGNNAYQGRMDGSLQGGSRHDGETTLGRWPANLIHDGSDEVVGLFPQAGGGFGVVGPKGSRSGGVMGKASDSRAGQVCGYGDTGSAARFFYCAKASKRDRDEGLEGFEAKRGDFTTCGLNDPKLREARGRAALETTRANIHPTVKPTDLMRYLCRLVTPPNGVVLDPFMGSGSTGKAAMLEGFRFVGIEREVEYLNIACKRIEKAVSQGQLFEPESVKPVQESMF